MRLLILLLTNGILFMVHVFPHTGQEKVRNTVTGQISGF